LGKGYLCNKKIKKKRGIASFEIVFSQNRERLMDSKVSDSPLSSPPYLLSLFPTS